MKKIQITFCKEVMISNSLFHELKEENYSGQCNIIDNEQIAPWSEIVGIELIEEFNNETN